MPRQLRSFFSSHGLDAKAPVLLALSGGMDSVVLSHLLKEEGFTFAAAHCNFGLRGKESDEDEDFCRRWAEKLEVPFFVQRFDTGTYASVKRISIQMAARDLRYAWFEELCAQHQYAYLLTAHHANDQAETVLLNLVRGTGLKGLGGIHAVNGNLVRPMLEWDRQEVFRYAKAYKLSWREDSSNSKTDYHRNALRHEVMPELEKMNPSFVEGMGRFTSLMQDYQQYFQQQYEQWKVAAVVSEGGNEMISKKVFFEAPKLFLHEWLQNYGFPHGLVAEIRSHAEPETGSLFQSSTHTLLSDREHFILSPHHHRSKAILLARDEKEFEWEGKKYFLNTIERTVIKDFSDYATTALLFDKDQLQFPIQLRTWQQGDRFTPLGMQGSKLLSDFFVDRKLSLFDKEKIGVLVSGDRIAGVLGHRIDDHYRISADTTMIWIIEKE